MRLRGTDMPRLAIFYRLMVRPLFHEPVRLALTVLAVALGVAVVLAIDLAGNAAAGSFHSSMETLAGDNDLEIVSPGGVPEDVLGKLFTEPYPVAHFTPHGRLRRCGGNQADPAVHRHRFHCRRKPLCRFTGSVPPNPAEVQQPSITEDDIRQLEDPKSVWVEQQPAQKSGRPCRAAHQRPITSVHGVWCLIRMQVGTKPRS